MHRRFQNTDTFFAPTLCKMGEGAQNVYSWHVIFSWRQGRHKHSASKTPLKCIYSSKPVDPALNFHCRALSRTMPTSVKVGGALAQFAECIAEDRQFVITGFGAGKAQLRP